jgi:glycerol-3-phosphate acyltransferase PlsY
MSGMTLFFFLLVSFLVGSAPFGLLLVKLAGKGDVRSVGSGNIGATNVVRAGGRFLGILTLALDASKGFFPVFFALHFFELNGAQLSLVSLVALAAVVGHIFTPWLCFKGGKGVATSLGAALAFCPWTWWMVLPSLGVFILSVALTRFISLGSILGAFALSVFLLIGLLKNNADEPMLTAAPWIAIALLVIIKHHANIRRLLNGTENPLWGSVRGGAADE